MSDTITLPNKPMTITLSNGAVVSGTYEQIVEFCKAFNIPLQGYYLSESKGLVKLVDMDNAWLKNATLKHYIGFLNTSRDLPLPEFTERIVGGPEPKRDSALYSLIEELARRATLESKGKL